MQNRPKGTARAAVACSTVPIVAIVVLVVLMYQWGYDEEAGSRAGAEPVVAGLFIAAPFAVLLVVQALGVIGMAAAPSRRTRLACLSVTATVSALTLAASHWLYGDSPLEGAERVVLGLALVLPLLFAWVAVARSLGVDPERKRATTFGRSGRMASR